MTEFFALAVGFISAWAFVILGVLALAGILTEYNDATEWTVFFMLCAAGVAWVTFSIPLVMLAIGVVVYIAAGVFWSFWRYRRFIAKKIEQHATSGAAMRASVLERIHPKNMLGTITAWIVVWPVSMVENLVGDLISFIHSLVTKFFRGVYLKIYEAAVAALKTE